MLRFRREPLRASSGGMRRPAAPCADTCRPCSRCGSVRAYARAQDGGRPAQAARRRAQWLAAKSEHGACRYGSWARFASEEMPRLESAGRRVGVCGRAQRDDTARQHGFPDHRPSLYKPPHKFGRLVLDTKSTCGVMASTQELTPKVLVSSNLGRCIYVLLFLWARWEEALEGRRV